VNSIVQAGSSFNKKGWQTDSDNNNQFVYSAAKSENKNVNVAGFSTFMIFAVTRAS
jgi:hypothetical protein